MKIMKAQSLAFFVSLLSLSSCLTSQKMDKFVADQYGNQVPKQDKKKKNDITVNSSLTSPTSDVSTTVPKTSHMLPLVVYWQWDHRFICSLNPAIPVSNFTNAINSLAGKGLNQKLNGQKLELTVEQAPNGFALVDKAHLIWLVYAYSWDRIYMEPDFKDLVVSYRLLLDDKPVKTGKISIKNTDKNRGLRFFQSWKSATSEYLTAYNSNLSNMTKSFVTKLMEEL